MTTIAVIVSRMKRITNQLEKVKQSTRTGDENEFSFFSILH